MKSKTTFISLVILCVAYHSLYTQNSSIRLDRIKGIVYEINDDMDGYVDHIDKFPVNDIIYPKDIIYPETKMVNGFDGIFPNDSFAIIFTGNIITEVDGLYELSVTSDDGTILWVDDIIRINNDGTHPMLNKRDSIYLNKGSIPFRLWYYQDKLNKMGLLFEQSLIRAGEEAEEIVEFESQLLFEVGQSELKAEAHAALDAFINRIKDRSDINLVIEGHTDSTGKTEFNETLSLNRALAVKSYIDGKVANSKIRTEAIGKGSRYPKKIEHTDEDRIANRRVEILVFSKK